MHAAIYKRAFWGWGWDVVCLSPAAGLRSRGEIAVELEVGRGKARRLHN